VNPADERFKHLIGKEALVPMSGGRRIPIIADEYVDMEFGTGCLKITPGHDNNDYEIGKRFDLPIISIMNKDASMNSNAGRYEGLGRYECRKQLWADMEEAGLAIKREPYTTRVPRSQRGGEVRNQTSGRSVRRDPRPLFFRRGERSGRFQQILLLRSR
jgi:valyl-tRNA synthetase